MLMLKVSLIMTNRKITHFVAGGASAGILNSLLAPDEKYPPHELTGRYC